MNFESILFKNADNCKIKEISEEQDFITCENAAIMSNRFIGVCT